jgi:hypothetical protein
MENDQKWFVVKDLDEDGRGLFRGNIKAHLKSEENHEDSFIFNLMPSTY